MLGLLVQVSDTPMSCARMRSGSKLRLRSPLLVLALLPSRLFANVRRPSSRARRLGGWRPRGPRLETAQDLGEFVADERKVRQITLNLLSNAVKFTPDGGRVDLRAQLVDGGIEIAVADTGIGIAPEDQAAVFEEFRQVGSDSGRKSEGTGLGLALARRFVELHGGTIRVESAPGRGTTFTFSLPRRSPPARGALALDTPA
jgi:signal transduction histidine kinase